MDERPTKPLGPIGCLVAVWRLSPVLTLVTLAYLCVFAWKVYVAYLPSGMGPIQHGAPPASLPGGPSVGSPDDEDDD